MWGVTVARIYHHCERRSIVLIRLALGAAEAGIYPGVSYFIAKWYRKNERGKRFGLMLLMSPIFTVFGAFLAYGLVDIEVGVLSGWRVLLLIEGAPAIIIGVIIYFVIADTPEDASWLTEEESRSALRRMAAAPADHFDKMALVRDDSCPLIFP